MPESKLSVAAFFFSSSLPFSVLGPFHISLIQWSNFPSRLDTVLRTPPSYLILKVKRIQSIQRDVLSFGGLTKFAACKFDNERFPLKNIS